MPKPKGSSPVLKLMTPEEVDGYHKYQKNHRERLPQDDKTRAGNTAYSRAKRTLRSLEGYDNG